MRHGASYELASLPGSSETRPWGYEHGSPAVFKAFRVEAKGERGSAPTCGDPSALLHLIYKVFIHLARKSQLTLTS